MKFFTRLHLYCLVWFILGAITGVSEDWRSYVAVIIFGVIFGFCARMLFEEEIDGKGKD